MPLPKSSEELKALKEIIKSMVKLIATKSSKTGLIKIKKDNVSKFDEYAADASSVLGPSIGKSILSLKKACVAKKPKSETIDAKAAKVLATFEKLSGKVESQMAKVKEAEKKKADKAKALAAKAKAKAAEKAAKEKVKAKKAKTTTKPKAKKAKKATKAKTSPSKSSASYMWGGDDEEDSDMEF